MSELLSSLLYGVGLVIGVVMALVFSLLLRFVTGPIIEALQEREELPQTEVTDFRCTAPCAVIVSDLHVDTWPLAQNDPDYTDKTPQFTSFIDALITSEAVEAVYFGGDFADIPLHPKFFFQPPLLEVHKEIHDQPSILMHQDNLLPLIFPLLEKKRVVGITGNHDLGINGLRFVHPQLALWNPSLLIAGHPSGPFPGAQKVYIEHGHRFDPLNWLYLRYSLMDLTRKGYDEGPLPTPPVSERKLRQLVESGLGIEDRKKIPIRQGMPRRGESPTQETPAPVESKDSGLTWLVRMRYRGAARKALSELKKVHPGVSVFVCGHTHVPDRYVFPNGDVYINLGDWSGDTPHQTYAVIDASGAIHGPLAWDGTL